MTNKIIVDGGNLSTQVAELIEKSQELYVNPVVTAENTEPTVPAGPEIVDAVEIEESEEQQAPVQVTDQSPLTQTTTFLTLSFGMLGHERTAKGEEQNITTSAEKSMLRVKKQLFVSPEWRAIQRADARFKHKIQKKCIEGILEGVRVIPNGHVDEVNTMCLMHTKLRAGLVDKFAVVYPDLYAKAKLLLGPLFKESEYPTPDNVRQAFRFTFKYVSFEVPGHLKSVSGAVYEQQVKMSGEIMQNASVKVAEMQTTLMAALVEKLKEELTPAADGKEKRLHKSAITKLQAFLADWNIMNVTNNTELAAFVKKADALMNGVTVASLKESDVAKANLLQSITEIGDALKPLVEDKGRKLKAVA